MRIGILGSGLMGKEVARDLIGNESVVSIGLADIDLNRAQKVCDNLNSPKLVAYQVNASNEEDLANYMSQFDVIVNALFYSFNEVVTKTAIRVGVNCVDLGGQIIDNISDIKKEATAAGIILIPELGVAPGMINILTGYGAKKLDKLDSVKIYVGGIPVEPEGPLKYNQVFSMEGVLDGYTDESRIIRNGSNEMIPSLSEIEKLHFENFGELEAFHTPGGASTLVTSYPGLTTFEYKTIRYPGHAEKFQLLVDLNLTRKDYEIELNGENINPRQVLLKVLEPIVDLRDKCDAVLLKVIVSGEKDNTPVTYSYEMTTYKDEENNVTAMARTTAYTISVVAQMIGEGIITKKGYHPPELIVPGEIYMKEMEKRGVTITESRNSETPHLITN